MKAHAVAQMHQTQNFNCKDAVSFHAFALKPRQMKGSDSCWKEKVRVVSECSDDVVLE